MTTIRFATDDDFDYCWNIDKDFQLAPQGEKRLRYKIEMSEIFIAEHEGKPVGYMRVDRFFARLPYIGLIYVEKDLRAQGIGKALLNFLEERTASEGGKFILSSSQENEPEPQYWHKKWGFREAGRISDVNEDYADEIVFRKNIKI